MAKKFEVIDVTELGGVSGNRVKYAREAAEEFYESGAEAAKLVLPGGINAKVMAAAISQANKRETLHEHVKFTRRGDAIFMIRV